MSREIVNIEEIKNAVSMSEIVSGLLNHPLDSRNRCTCPVHQGTDKNFSVKNDWAKCWSTCDQSWDKLGLIMAAKKVSFTEALNLLAGYAGILIRYADGSQQKNTWFKAPPPAPKVLKRATDIDHIPPPLFKKTLQHYGRNNFYHFLRTTFGDTIANRLVQDYQLGTSKYWPGAAIFWQIDTQLRVRTGKVMLYHPQTGKRNRSVNPYWAHRIINEAKQDFKLSQCLFGEHLLLNLPTNTPTALVESEKTAMVMAAIKPEVCWLACGSMSGLTPTRCAALKGRKTILYPDLDAYDKWSEQALKLNEQGFKLTVSELLREKAGEKDYAGKYDIADYFLKQRDDKAGFLVLDGVPVFW
jgi:hypothetical protein